MRTRHLPLTSCKEVVTHARQAGSSACAVAKQGAYMQQQLVAGSLTAPQMKFRQGKPVRTRVLGALKLLPLALLTLLNSVLYS